MSIDHSYWCTLLQWYKMMIFQLCLLLRALKIWCNQSLVAIFLLLWERKFYSLVSHTGWLNSRPWGSEAQLPRQMQWCEAHHLWCDLLHLLVWCEALLLHLGPHLDVPLLILICHQCLLQEGFLHLWALHTFR